MSEKNCKELAKQSDIDGFLVGGASLKPACELHPRSCRWGGVFFEKLDVLTDIAVVDIINAKQ